MTFCGFVGLLPIFCASREAFENTLSFPGPRLQNTFASKIASFFIWASLLVVLWFARGIIAKLLVLATIGLLIGFWFIDHGSCLRAMASFLDVTPLGAAWLTFDFCRLFHPVFWGHVLLLCALASIDGRARFAIGRELMHGRTFDRDVIDDYVFRKRFLSCPALHAVSSIALTWICWTPTLT